MSTRTPSGHRTIRGAVLPLVLALLLPVLAHAAFAQQLAPGAQPPTAQPPAPLANAPPLVPAATPPSPGAPAPSAPAPPGATPAATTPTLPVPLDWGLCQCISDKQNLDFTCPGSADACQAACGKQFSFKPDARCRHAAAAQ